MPISEVYSPYHGCNVKFGRLPSDPSAPKLHLARYSRSLATPPPTADYSPEAASALSLVYLNDSLGCCVISAVFHYLGVITGNGDQGKPFLATDAQITASYSAIGGYVPGDPSTDQGCNLQTAMNYYVANPFPDGSRLLAWIAVDATNKTEVMQSVDEFENVYIGLSLPSAWVNQDMPQASGFVWGMAEAPDPSLGHCVLVVGYDATGVKISTWGLTGTITWAAFAYYLATANGGEVYGLLSSEIEGAGQAVTPSGLPLSTVIADFDQLGGKVPVPPVPVPPPAPNPAPTPPAPNPPPPAPPGVTYTVLPSSQANPPEGLDFGADTDFVLAGATVTDASGALLQLRFGAAYDHVDQDGNYSYAPANDRYQLYVLGVSPATTIDVVAEAVFTGTPEAASLGSGRYMFNADLVGTTTGGMLTTPGTLTVTINLNLPLGYQVEGGSLAFSAA